MAGFELQKGPLYPPKKGDSCPHVLNPASSNQFAFGVTSITKDPNYVSIPPNDDDVTRVFCRASESDTNTQSGAGIRPASPQIPKELLLSISQLFNSFNCLKNIENEISKAALENDFFLLLKKLVSKKSTKDSIPSMDLRVIAVKEISYTDDMTNPICLELSQMMKNIDVQFLLDFFRCVIEKTRVNDVPEVSNKSAHVDFLFKMVDALNGIYWTIFNGHLNSLKKDQLPVQIIEGTPNFASVLYNTKRMVIYLLPIECLILETILSLVLSNVCVCVFREHNITGYFFTDIVGDLKIKVEKFVFASKSAKVVVAKTPLQQSPSLFENSSMIDEVVGSGLESGTMLLSSVSVETFWNWFFKTTSDWRKIPSESEDLGEIKKYLNDRFNNFLSIVLKLKIAPENLSKFVEEIEKVKKSLSVQSKWLAYFCQTFVPRFLEFVLQHIAKVDAKIRERFTQSSEPSQPSSSGSGSAPAPAQSTNLSNCEELTKKIEKATTALSAVNEKIENVFDLMAKNFTTYGYGEQLPYLTTEKEKLENDLKVLREKLQKEANKSGKDANLLAKKLEKTDKELAKKLKEDAEKSTNGNKMVKNASQMCTLIKEYIEYTSTIGEFNRAISTLGGEIRKGFLKLFGDTSKISKILEQLKKIREEISKEEMTLRLLEGNKTRDFTLAILSSTQAIVDMKKEQERIIDACRFILHTQIPCVSVSFNTIAVQYISLKKIKDVLGVNNVRVPYLKDDDFKWVEHCFKKETPELFP